MEKSIGPINSIVLARAGESDKIYKKDQNSIDKNGLCELMIKENQFMNFNDRVDYLQELSDKLFGVEYYLNDFVSTGIMYYDLLDMYNIEIFGKTYNCLMLNDEQDITQGLEENIHTDRPEKSETDYKKADTTDKKINQTYLIVDKQNQKIKGVISQIGDRSNKTTTITADIDGINSKVSNITDLTKTTSGVGTLTLDNCANGELLQLNIYGNNTVFAPLVLSDDLYLSDSLFLRDVESILIVTDEKENTTNYDLKITDTLRQKNNVRDEYILDGGKAKIIRRINQDGSIKDNEEIEDLGELHIILGQGKNTIQIKDFSAEVQVKWAQKSDLTDTFATKVQLNTSITQTSTKIMTEVNKKVDEEELGTKIEQNSEAVKLAWNQISEYIQMMIINGNASFAILDQNKKILAALDRTGQHFYNNDKTMDIGAFDCYFPSYGNIYKSLMFALNEKSTNNFMAWGYKTTAENGKTTYTPVIYLGGNSDDDYGFHIENDIILNFNKIRLKKSKIYDNNDSLCFEIGEDLFYGDTRDNKEIFSVYKNSIGTKTFRIFGDDSNPIMIDSSGNFVLASGKIILDNNGNIDCVHLYQTGDSSDIRIKSNIKDSSESAIDIINKIHHKEFDKKDDNTHYKIGYIAQEMEQIDKNFVVKKQANKEKGIEERYYMNQLPILATATKAIQEQQEMIEKLENRIKEMEDKLNEIN
ncbi:MAG: tail fiber domain-containing protein [Clostridia bacterium]